VSVSAEYRIRTDLRARVGYLFESLSTDDWSFERVGPNTLSNVLTINEKSPSYHAHLLGVSLVYEFGR
jgi:hypothetical protein